MRPNLWQQTEELPHINMTPMVDVVLCLLVFFMVATRLYDWDESEFRIQVPTATSAAPLIEAPDDLVVTILEPGQVDVQGTVYGLGELEAILVNARERYADQGVQIRGDGALSYQHLADVLSVCNQAGIGNLRLRVRPPEESGRE